MYPNTFFIKTGKLTGTDAVQHHFSANLEQLLETTVWPLLEDAFGHRLATYEVIIGQIAFLQQFDTDRTHIPPSDIFFWYLHKLLFEIALDKLETVSTNYHSTGKFNPSDIDRVIQTSACSSWLQAVATRRNPEFKTDFNFVRYGWGHKILTLLLRPPEEAFDPQAIRGIKQLNNERMSRHFESIAAKSMKTLFFDLTYPTPHHPKPKKLIEFDFGGASSSNTKVVHAEPRAEAKDEATLRL